MSLRLRLLLILAPLFVVGLAAADIGTYLALQTTLLSGVDNQLRSAHIALESAALNPGNDSGSPSEGGAGPVSGAVAFEYPPGTYVVVLNSRGNVVGSPLLFFFGGLVSSTTHPVLPSTLPPYKTPTTVDGSGSVAKYRIYVDNVDNPNYQGDIIIAALPLDSVNATLSRLLLFELAISGGITLVIIAATWLMVRRGLRPLERMGATARSIAASDLSKRVTPSTESTEVGRLGLALNTMLAQLESAFDERAASERRLRHFVSDASHELRTPLTSMRGYAELLQRNPDMSSNDFKLALRRIEEEASRMGVLVDDLLLLARLDQGRPLERKSLDLEALVRDACADARAVDGNRAINLRVDEPLVVSGDDLRLRQAVGNLVRNALVHTPAGTPVDVLLTSHDGTAIVEVVDHGAGIPPGQTERIFERFHRADPRRSGDQGGSGLGLSIASAVVSAHGGRIIVRDTPGGGATFRIELPKPDGPEGVAP